jgi:hypothetical protein
MWIILDVIRWTGVLFFALIAARIAGAIACACLGRDEDERGVRGWRWWAAWAILLAIGASLVDLQFGGFYLFTDPERIDWSFDGHGWPLVHQYSLWEASSLTRSVDVAIYFAALAVNLLSLVVLLTAARFVVDRWFFGAAGARPTRRDMATAAAGWLAALAGVLWIERFFAGPVAMPGTEIMVYTPFVHLPWYNRCPVVFALACALFILGWWFSRGVKAFFRLREEGVL